MKNKVNRLVMISILMAILMLNSSNRTINNQSDSLGKKNKLISVITFDSVSIQGVVLNGKYQLDIMKKKGVKNINFYKTWRLNNKSVIEFESKNVLYNKKIQDSLLKINPNSKSLNLYKRQYIPVYNSNSQKCIVVTFSIFDSDILFYQIYYEKFIREFRRVLDGGSDYFYLIYNLENNTVEFIQFNRNW